MGGAPTAAAREQGGHLVVPGHLGGAARTGGQVPPDLLGLVGVDGVEGVEGVEGEGAQQFALLVGHASRRSRVAPWGLDSCSIALFTWSVTQRAGNAGPPERAGGARLTLRSRPWRPPTPSRRRASAPSSCATAS